MTLSSALDSIAVAVGLKRPLREPLASREDLSTEEIQRRFYPDLNVARDDFAGVWQDIADVFSVPATRIRPDDRFGRELPLKPLFGLTDEDLMLGSKLGHRMKQFGLEGKTPELKSVDDYVRYLLGPR